MNEQDLMIGFTLGENIESYKRLCAFVKAMQDNQYLAISDDDIKQGVEYEKARLKLIKKLFQQIIPYYNHPGFDELIDAYCEECHNKFINFKQQHHT